MLFFFLSLENRLNIVWGLLQVDWQLVLCDPLYAFTADYFHMHS